MKVWKARLDHICKTLDVDEEIVSVHDHHKVMLIMHILLIQIEMSQFCLYNGWGR